ncbi:MAG: antibiotic biosynthesis monooxygenase [Armatimonadota bacterium]|nr:antibiotic biosynthesis monooxygenase [Armatimonadota bacterium]
MYLVVSYWESMLGREAEFEALGRTMTGILRQQPGVIFAEAFHSDNGKHVAVAGYESEAAYQALADNPDSDMARAAAEHQADEVSRWVGSERGETFPHE